MTSEERIPETPVRTSLAIEPQEWDSTREQRKTYLAKIIKDLLKQIGDSDKYDHDFLVERLNLLTAILRLTSNEVLSVQNPAVMLTAITAQGKWFPAKDERFDIAHSPKILASANALAQAFSETGDVNVNKDVIGTAFGLSLQGKAEYKVEQGRRLNLRTRMRGVVISFRYATLQHLPRYVEIRPDIIKPFLFGIESTRRKGY